MPLPMTIAEMAIAIGLSAPLNFMIPRFKSDMSSVLPQLQLDCSFALWRMTVKSNAITDFFNNPAAAMSGGEGHSRADTELVKITYKKDLTNPQN